MRRVFYKQGLTAIETIATIAITILIFAAVSYAITSFYRSNSYTIEQSFAVNSARKGVETMVSNIREATYSDTGAYPVVSAATSSFRFYSDIDRDMNIEKIRYFLDGSDFKKGEIQATGNPPVYNDSDEVISVLSEYIRNTSAQPIFRYYDKDGNEIVDLSQVADIASVKVRLIVNVVEGRAPEEFTLNSHTNLRNLKDNL